MKKSLLSSVLMLGMGYTCAFAQVYSPAASALPNGQSGQVYAGQVINVNIPTEITINTSIFGDPLIIPGVPFPIPNPNQDLSAQVTSTVLTVAGLPSGLSYTCSPANCTFPGGSSGTISIVGTPTQAGTFTIDITSLTNGSADVPQLGVTPFPQPVPSALDEEGYTMAVANPASIAEHNDVFALSVYPNPTEGIATLDVKANVGGVATVEIYSITGSMVQRTAQTIATGLNRVNLDMTALPAGIYMVRAEVNGRHALVRVQKG